MGTIVYTHTVVGRDGGATKYTDNASYYKRTDTSSTYNTGSSGSHTHSVTVDKSGEGKSHNTMQPYLTILQCMTLTVTRSLVILTIPA